jgi:hypothetical protein
MTKDLIGKTIGTYRIESEIGESRWGKIYRATQTTVYRTVALKTLAPEFARLPGKSDSFLEEMRAEAQIIHSHIVTVYEAGYADGLHFCAMEYMDGPELGEFLRQGDGVNEHHLLQTMSGVAQALDFLWQRNVPHQPPDLSNILTYSSGVVKLTNIRPLDAAPAESPRADIQALGLILGTLVNQIAPVRRPIAELVQRMFDPTGRETFGSLAEVVRAATALDLELFPPAMHEVRQPAIQPKKTGPLFIALALLAAVAVVAGLAAWQLRRIKKDQPVAADKDVKP